MPIADDIPEDSLTPREREVLALLIAGKSNAAIANELLISQRTVTTHLTRLYAKLEVSSRTEAISAAMRLGLGIVVYSAYAGMSASSTKPRHPEPKRPAQRGEFVSKDPSAEYALAESHHVKG